MTENAGENLEKLCYKGFTETGKSRFRKKTEQSTEKHGIYVVMETENVRHLWHLKGGRVGPSGKEEEAALAGKRKATQNSGGQPSFLTPGSTRSKWEPARARA